jgi:hypothetical protein
MRYFVLSYSSIIDLISQEEYHILSSYRQIQVEIVFLYCK